MSDKPIIDWDGEPIPLEQWGKDHWSTFAYAECRVVDHGGFLDPAHLRDADPKYPTRCKSFQVSGHGDLDCLRDAMAAGLVEDLFCDHRTKGESRDPRYILSHSVVFTEEGLRVVGDLRTHTATGGNFAEFVPSPRAVLVVREIYS